MPEPKIVEPAAETEGAKPQGPPKAVRLGILAGAVVVGLGVGAMVVGPKFAPSATPAVSGSETADAHKAKAHKAKKKPKHNDPASAIKIDNVICNPAGAQGQHFLMATVVFEVGDQEAEKFLESNQYVVRDIVLSTLGSQTLEDLSRPTIREDLKKLLAQNVGQLVGDPEVLTVYIPQFVVQ